MAPLPPDFRGPGLRVRFRRLSGITPKTVLRDPLYLPVTLGEFTVDEVAEHRDYTTVAAGEFSTPAAGPPTARSLRTTTLDTLTIDWHRYARWLVNPRLSPAAAKRELYRILRYRRPFEVLAILQLGGGQPEELRMKATLRAINRTLRPGEADTRYYTIELKEWRDNTVERTGRGGGRDTLPTTATLTAETTLHSLATHFYSSAPEWRLIAAANGITSWGPGTPLADSRRFKVGDKVKIPKPVTASI